MSLKEAPDELFLQHWDPGLRQEIADRLRECRSQSSFSQGDIAYLLMRTQAQISRYESGKRLIPADDLARIARNLRVPIQQFFPEDLRDFVSPEEARLLTAWRTGNNEAVLRLLSKRKKNNNT